MCGVAIIAMQKTPFFITLKREINMLFSETIVVILFNYSRNYL